MAFLAGIGLTGCSDDYTDWANPVSNAQEDAITIEGFSATGVDPIVLADVNDATVQTYSLNLGELPEGYTVTDANFVLTPSDTENAKDVTPISLATSINYVSHAGTVATEDLANAVSKAYSDFPTARTFTGQVMLTATSDGGVNVTNINAGTVTVTVTPDAPPIYSTYYITGGINGWDNTNTDYAVSNGGGDVYENSVFTITLSADVVGEGFEFKFTPAEGLGGDWSLCVTAPADGTASALANANEGDNLKVTPIDGAKFYRLSFDMMNLTWTETAINFDPFVYFIGSTDGWQASEQRLALTDQDNGIYTGYVYVADPNGWGKAFKLQTVQGSWDGQVNAGNTTITSGLTGTDNFEVAEDGVYYITYNASAQTIEAVKINNMNLVGSHNSWNQADDTQQMIWNASEMCYEFTNATVNENGWKFTANNAWDINLGANDTVEPSTKIDDLSAGGKNLGVVGTTIKLYPCRTTSGNIYCTVE